MSSYVFDHAFELERERLTVQEQWLDPGTSRVLDRIGVALGWRCLEVAAGAGSIVRELSARVGRTGSVLATDLDLKFLQGLDLPNVEVRAHDIINDPVEENSFDLVHTRLLLMHLPGRDEALKRMIAAAKPGGFVFVEDFDMLTFVNVNSPALDRVRDALYKLFEMAGATPFYGRSLPFVLSAAGLDDVWAEGRVAWGYRWENPGLKSFKLMMQEMREPFAKTGLVTTDDIDSAIATLDDPAWEGMPPMMVSAYGRKPG